MGSKTAGMIADSALRSVESLTAAIDAYAKVGVDELILDPTVSDPEQVDLLAEASCRSRGTDQRWRYDGS